MSETDQNKPQTSKPARVLDHAGFPCATEDDVKAVLERLNGTQDHAQLQVLVGGLDQTKTNPQFGDQPMKLNTYQDLADRTMNRTMPLNAQITNGVLGLGGESGEVSEIVKKHLYHGHDLDVDRLKNELGDVLWYVATLAKTLGLSLEEVAQANIDKLQARYPEGFDSERSRQRTV